MAHAENRLGSPEYWSPCVRINGGEANWFSNLLAQSMLACVSPPHRNSASTGALSHDAWGPTGGPALTFDQHDLASIRPRCSSGGWMWSFKRGRVGSFCAEEYSPGGPPMLHSLQPCPAISRSRPETFAMGKVLRGKSSHASTLASTSDAPLDQISRRGAPLRTNQSGQLAWPAATGW